MHSYEIILKIYQLLLNLRYQYVLLLVKLSQCVPFYSNEKNDFQCTFKKKSSMLTVLSLF